VANAEARVIAANATGVVAGERIDLDAARRASAPIRSWLLVDLS